MPDRPPIVFLSYSHDSDVHKARVKALSDQLRGEGVNAILDQDEESPEEGWPRWMDRWVREADYVLVVCTRLYFHRTDAEDLAGRGLGVRWESTLTYQILYDAGTANRRFIPVLFDEADKMHIPLPLRGATRYLLQRDYDLLYQRVCGAGPKRQQLGALRSARRPLDTAVSHPLSRPDHRIIAITGLTSAGKDSLLTDLFNEHLVHRDDFFFPTKVISRDPRPEEHLIATRGVRDFPYLVTRRDRAELERNEHNQFFSVYNRYGNIAGFVREELEIALSRNSPVTVVYIQPEIERLAQHKSEIQMLSTDISGREPHKLTSPVHLEVVLIEAPREVCRSRLIRRGLPPPYRDRRAAGIEHDWEIALRLKEERFFDAVVDNSNSRAFDQAKQQLLSFLEFGQ